MEVVQVQPRDAYSHFINAAKGQVIHWSFNTKRRNIMFGLYKRQDSTQLRCLVTNMSDMTFSPDGKSSFLESDPNPSPVHSTHRQRSKSITSEKLREQGNWQELLPIEQYDSADAKVEGSFRVEETGDYMLVFDNTFSKTTPKDLTFTVTVTDDDKDNSHTYAMEGWMLKKRRKKLQGWAKRYFVLSPSGKLSYSVSKNKVSRGAVQIGIAKVVVMPPQRAFYIESGATVYQLKALSDEDQKLWTEAIQSFLPTKQVSVDQHDHQNSTLAKADWSGVDEGLSQSISLENDMSKFGFVLDQLLAQLQPLANTMDNPPWSSHLSELHKVRVDMAHNIRLQTNRWQCVQEMVRSLPSSAVPLSPISKPSIRNSRINASSRSSIMSEKFYDAIDIPPDQADEFECKEDDNKSTSTIGDSDTELDDGNDSPLSESTFALNLPRRRTTLSAKSPSKDPTFKDLMSSISAGAARVFMNEPLSMLQKSCEELEYLDLLDEAAGQPDSMERLKNVALFTVASFASSALRTRKPFNPLMNETYECIRPDMGFRFIAEKVSHRPVVVAAHADGQSFTYDQCTEVVTKSGMSTEIISKGLFHIRLRGHDDQYTYTKPPTYIRFGRKVRIEHVGKTVVTNYTTGETAEVTFEAGGSSYLYSSTSCNEISIQLYDAHHNLKGTLSGKWNERITDQNGRVVWEARQPPSNCQDYFGFTQLGIELNEITPLEKDRLPITDSRLRPDQRLYEEGDLDTADQEKLRLEEKQRQRTEWEAVWFDKKWSEEQSGWTWVYSGTYWKTRESGKWPGNLPNIW